MILIVKKTIDFHKYSTSIKTSFLHFTFFVRWLTFTKKNSSFLRLFFLSVDQAEWFLFRSFNDRFFSFPISSIFEIENCATSVESWEYNIRGGFPSRGESSRLLIKYFIVIIDSLTNTNSYVTKLLTVSNERIARGSDR